MAEVHIWRYMSLAKYVDLLRSKSVYCPKASLFQDETEGKWIAHAILWGERKRWELLRGSIRQLQQILERAEGKPDALLSFAKQAYSSLSAEGKQSALGGILEGVSRVYADKRKDYIEGTIKNWVRLHDNHNTRVAEWRRQVMIERESTYVSCWHRADSMSLAMWNLYGGGTESIAIRVDVHKLESLLTMNAGWLKERSLDGEVMDVVYIDGLADPKEDLQGDLLERLGVGGDVRVGSFSVKPAMYSYEREVRLIVYPKLDPRQKVVDPNPEVDGFSLSIGNSAASILDFIGAVYVHPLLGSDSMMFRVIQTINEMFGVPDMPIIVDRADAIGANLALQPIETTDSPSD